MSLSLREKRCVFSRNISQLVLWAIDQGFEVAYDQVKRTQAEADANAASGAGIKNSLHLYGLAADLILYRDGKYLTDTEDYRLLGEHWKTLHPDNRWGGDFTKRKDGNHYSMTHWGIS